MCSLCLMRLSKHGFSFTFARFYLLFKYTFPTLMVINHVFKKFSPTFMALFPVEKEVHAVCLIRQARGGESDSPPLFVVLCLKFETRSATFAASFFV